MPSSARIEFLQRGTAKREYIYQDTASSTKGSQSIRYSIEQMCLGRVSPGATWELPTYYVTLDDAPSLRRFVLQEFEQIESVRDIVTLTGDLPNVWAAICQEYTSWRWPLISECVLELIDTIIKGPHSALKEFDRALRTNPDHTLLTPGASRVEFYGFGGRRIRINDDPLILADVLEALSWFTAALRTSDQRVPGPSVVEVLKDDNEFVVRLAKSSTNPREIRQELLSRFNPSARHEADLTPQRNAGCCWYPLFPRARVAAGFPIPGRPRKRKDLTIAVGLDLQGLEVSFAVLSHICGLEYSAFHGDNFVLRGELTALYPIYAQGGSVQWHLKFLAKTRPDNPDNVADDMKNDMNDGISEFDVEPEDQGMPVSIVAVEDLPKASRHFVGLWPEAQITLGTRKHKYSKIQWSSNDEKTEISRKDGTSFSIGLGLKGFGTLTASRSFKIGRTRLSPAQNQVFYRKTGVEL